MDHNEILSSLQTQLMSNFYKVSNFETWKKIKVTLFDLESKKELISTLKKIEIFNIDKLEKSIAIFYNFVSLIINKDCPIYDNLQLLNLVPLTLETWVKVFASVKVALKEVEIFFLSTLELHEFLPLLKLYTFTINLNYLCLFDFFRNKLEFYSIINDGPTAKGWIGGSI